MNPEKMGGSEQLVAAVEFADARQRGGSLSVESSVLLQLAEFETAWLMNPIDQPMARIMVLLEVG